MSFEQSPLSIDTQTAPSGPSARRCSRFECEYEMGRVRCNCRWRYARSHVSLTELAVLHIVFEVVASDPIVGTVHFMFPRGLAADLLPSGDTGVSIKPFEASL